MICSHTDDIHERKATGHHSNLYYVFDRMCSIEFLWNFGFREGRESIFGGENRTLYTKESGWLE